MHAFPGASAICPKKARNGDSESDPDSDFDPDGFNTIPNAPRTSNPAPRTPNLPAKPGKSLIEIEIGIEIEIENPFTNYTTARRVRQHALPLHRPRSAGWGASRAVRGARCRVRGFEFEACAFGGIILSLSRISLRTPHRKL